MKISEIELTSQKIWLVFVAVIYFSKHSDIKIGPDKSEPEFNDVTWQDLFIYTFRNQSISWKVLHAFCMWSRNWCFLLWCGRARVSLHWSQQILSRSLSARQSTGSECHSSNILPLGSACLGNLHHCWFTTWNHGTQVSIYSGWVGKDP